MNFFRVLPRSFFEVHDTDLQHLVGFGIVDKVMETTPGTFQFLEILVVYDRIDLFGQFLVDLRNDSFYGTDNVIGNDRAILQHLLCKRLYRIFDRLF